jgi:hypothetical protein
LVSLNSSQGVGSNKIKTHFRNFDMKFELMVKFHEIKC